MWNGTKIRTLLANALRYNAIRGAVVVKFIQLALQVSGHAPWSDDQAELVSMSVDGLVMLLVIAGVGQAHAADPTGK